MARLDLIITSQKNPPARKFVRIILADYPSDKERIPFLSARIYTEMEVDYGIDFLIDQLNKLRSKAKRELRKK